MCQRLAHPIEQPATIPSHTPIRTTRNCCAVNSIDRSSNIKQIRQNWSYRLMLWASQTVAKRPIGKELDYSSSSVINHFLRRPQVCKRQRSRRAVNEISALSSNEIITAIDLSPIQAQQPFARRLQRSAIHQRQQSLQGVNENLVSSSRSMTILNDLSCRLNIDPHNNTNDQQSTNVKSDRGR